ncbi:hypothetical protein OH687_09865 [Burkholderia anthina]|nr:hypothetical protein OH687_09865 [Burkholderia anthina]
MPRNRPRPPSAQIARSSQYGFISAADRRNRPMPHDIRLILLIDERK